MWENVENITASLRPARVALESLWNKRMILGNFYAAWLKCYVHTSRIDSPLAQALVKSMKEREQGFCHTNTFCAALYMDPRDRVVLTPEQKSRAIEHLRKTWNRISGLPQKQEGSGGVQVSAEAASPVEPQDDLEAFLCEKEAEAGVNHDFSNDLHTVLEMLGKEPRVQKSTNVLAHWKNRKQQQPELYALEKVVLAVPATRFGVNLAISALSYASSDPASYLKGALK